MAKTVKPIPDGYHTFTPYLYIRGAAEAIEFYKRAFGAKEHFRMPTPGGKIGHAEIQIGDSMIMLADESPERGVRSPQSLNGTSFGCALYVEDVDSAYKRAVDAGATVIHPLADQFYGDRSGTVNDPFGHQWTLSTHKEDVAPEEMEKRAKAAFGQKAGAS